MVNKKAPHATPTTTFSLNLKCLRRITSHSHLSALIHSEEVLYAETFFFLQTFMAIVDVVFYITNRISYLSATVTDCRLVDCG